MAIVAKPIGANTACVSLEEFNNESRKNFINDSIGSFNDLGFEEADPTLVSIQENVNDPALTEVITYISNPDLFFHSTALEEIIDSNKVQLKTLTKVSGGNLNTTSHQVFPKWEFYTDTDLISINLRSNSQYTVQIDGVFVSKVTQIASDYGSSGADLLFTFSDRRVRKITINFNTWNSGFGGVSKRPTDTVWKNSNKLKACFIGDSFSAGSTPNVPALAYPTILMNSLNIDEFMINGEGGTGFVNNQGSTRLNYLERITDTTSIDFDLIFVSSSRNDSGFTDSEIETAVDNWYNLIRASLPNSTIIVLGTPSSYLNSLAEKEQVVIDRFLDKKDDRVFAVPVMGDNNPPVTGSGNDSSPANDGNADNYVSSDAVHYNQSGHEYYGFWLAQKVFNLLKG